MKRIVAALAVSLVGAFSLTTSAKADPSVQALAIAAGTMIAANYILDLPQPDADRSFLNATGGAFDYPDQDDQATFFGLEYWTPWTVVKLRPFVGGFGTTDGGFAGYAGIRQDLHIGDHIVVTVNTAPVLYAAGGGKHLGSYLVLRSGFELSYRFDNAMRISATFHHMSHAGLFDSQNPGTETVGLSLAIPMDSLLQQ